LSHPSEKYEFVNGKDDIPYMKWKIKTVPNHQPVYFQDFPQLHESSPETCMMLAPELQNIATALGILNPDGKPCHAARVLRDSHCAASKWESEKLR